MKILQGNICIMSDDDNLIPQKSLSKLSNTTNKMYTLSPCRRVGLKRKSTSTPFHTNIVLKKTKTLVELENEKIINSNTKDQLNCKWNTIQKVKLEKQHEIENLKSELENNKQHNLNQIQELSKKWLGVCQEALMSLLSQLNTKENSILYSMEDLITNLGIDPDLINFDCNNQEFI